ncbi:MAG: protein phosphatase 2C domain-containing protein [Myxococcota bacterium]
MYSATHVGRDHQRVGRNNQDGVFATPSVVVVTDGCSSQPQSEVGAQLGARFLGQWLGRQSLSAELPARAVDALCGFVYQAARSLEAEQLEEVLERYFLFTFLAAVKQGDRAILFGLGDGGFVVDDEVVRLDAGADNAPPYAAYRLTAIGARPEPQLHFFGTASRLAVMTDGLNPLEPPRLRALVETSGLSRNPLTLQRRLNVLAESERFADDATLAVLGS